MPTNTNHHDHNLEAGFLSTTDGTVTLDKTTGLHRPHARRSVRPKDRMPSPRHLITALVVCFLVTLGLASAIRPRLGRPYPNEEVHLDTQTEAVVISKHGADSDTSGFSQLLRSASPDVLHRLLHSYFPDTYRHGIYASDHEALAAVHADNAGLATTLARLARRQNDNSTTTSQPPPETSSPPPTTSSPPPRDTTTPPPPPPPPPPPTTPSPTPTPPPPPPDPGTSPEEQPPAPPSPESTPSSPDDLLLSPLSAPDSPPDSTPIVPPTVPPTSSFQPAPPTSLGVTTTPKPTRSPSLSPVPMTYTSTLPNGDVVFVTSTSFVAYYPDETGPNGKPTASLQNAAPRRTGEVAVPALLGVVIGGLMAL